MYKKALFILFFISLICTGCSGKNMTKETMAQVWETQIPIPTGTGSVLPVGASVSKNTEPTASPVPVLKENMTGKAQNPLTGLYIDKATAARRPYAVVINNLHKALPQSGIGQADIIYEVLAEGDITRLIAIFQDFNSEKIGPVRSAREYFLDFAFNHDAYFVHHGGSPGGYTAIKSTGINDFDGMALEGVTFWRDKNRLNQPGMYEHSSYTDSEKLLAGAEKKGFRTERNEGAENMLSFYAIALSPPMGVTANKITVPFSKNYTSVFEYDPESHLYKKFQSEEKHIDEETGEQLAFTNIIIQFADMYIISGDEAGRRHVDTVGSGKGYIITNGKYSPVTWKKNSQTSVTEWYDELGGRLKVNKGKTWICVYKGEVLFE